MPAQEDISPEVTVTEMNHKRLTINIKPRKSKKKNTEEADDEGDDYSPPSSADIEVVHRHPKLNLHSILKQRTMSESSEDFHTEDLSPRSGEDCDPLSTYNKRRSVSFNTYVDRASFKSCAAPASMTSVLKSKRRRQRKHEMKLNGKSRKNSGGTSEGSSNEEGSHHSYDSHSFSEDDVEFSCSVPETVPETATENDAQPIVSSSSSDPSITAEVQQPSESIKKKGKRGGRKKKRASNKVQNEAESSERSETDEHQLEDDSETDGVSQSEVRSIPGSDESLDFRTIVDEASKKNECKNVNVEHSSVKNGVESVTDKNKRIVSEIKDKMAAGTAKNGGGDVKKEDACDDSDDDFVDAVSSMADESESKLSVDSSKSTNSGGGDQGSEPSNGKDGGDQKSEVETMLSWDEGSANGGEHATQCAFKFSNALLFDLDVD